MENNFEKFEKLEELVSDLLRDLRIEEQLTLSQAKELKAFRTQLVDANDVIRTKDNVIDQRDRQMSALSNSYNEEKNKLIEEKNGLVETNEKLNAVIADLNKQMTDTIVKYPKENAEYLRLKSLELTPFEIIKSFFKLFR